MQTSDNDRLAIPNEKLASDTIRNSTIRDPRRLAEVTVHVPLTADLRAAVATLEPGTDEVAVIDLGLDATIAVRRYVGAGEALEHGESELRLEISERLRKAGIVGVGE
jgi:small-conductance mechanosensitive channel